MSETTAKKASASQEASTRMADKICQHFLQGKCTRGEKCRFSHASAEGSSSNDSSLNSEASTPNTQVKRGERVCQHFLQGKCTRGEKCRFLHDAPAEHSSAVSERPRKKVKKSKELCKHYLNGECTRGHMCRFVHESKDGQSVPPSKGPTHGSSFRDNTSAGSTTKKRKRPGLQARRKKKDWLRYGAKLDNVMSIVKAKVGCTHPDAPLCRGHNAQCAKRKVDKPSAKRYGDEYWVCHKVVTGQASESCGHFEWVVHKS